MASAQCHNGLTEIVPTAELRRMLVLASDSLPRASPGLPPTANPDLIDSPLMRKAGRELLSLALMDARNHTLRLFGQYQNALEGVNFAVPQLDIVNPPLW